MASILQICIVLTATWITLSNGKHLWKEKELEKMELIEQMLKKEVQEQLAEEKAKEKEEAEAAPPPPPPPPPAPVIEVIPGEFFISKPFLPPEVKSPDGGKVERSLNTDISGALVKYETYVPIYGELPPKEEVPPPPPPAAPAPLLPPVLPPPAPVNPPPPPPPPTPIKWVPNFIGPNEAITLYRPPIIVQPPPPAPEPVPPPPPVSPPPPPPPVIPLPPLKEPMKPSKYAVYLGDMFLKLMGQLLSRARLTLNRLTGPPAVSPEEAGV